MGVSAGAAAREGDAEVLFLKRLCMLGGPGLQITTRRRVIQLCQSPFPRFEPDKKRKLKQNKKDAANGRCSDAVRLKGRGC